MLGRQLVRKLSQIPTLPVTDKSLGNLLEIGQAGSIHQFLLDNHSQLGPIFKFRFGQLDSVSLCDIQMWKETGKLVDRPVSIFESFKPLIGEYSIQFANTPEFQRRKKAYISPAFSMRAIQNLHYKAVEDNLKDWCLPFLKQNSHQQLNLQLLSESLILKILVRGAFGQISSSQIEDVRQSYQQVFQFLEGTVRGINPDKELFEEGQTRFSQIIQELLEGQKNKDEQTFLSYLLNEKNEKLIRDECLTFLIGGYHTSSNWITWTLYFLAKYPQEQQKVYESLLLVPDFESLPFEYVNKIIPLQNAVDESLRLSTLAPYAARVNDHDDIILSEGYKIPKGTPILLALGVMGKRPDLWENPDQFNPDRFLSVWNKGLKFSPFGFAGGRICPGQNLATYETQGIVATILKHYQLELDVNHPEVEYNYGLATSPSIDINMIFKPRA